jgi:hypothetical protein
MASKTFVQELEVLFQTIDMAQESAVRMARNKDEPMAAIMLRDIVNQLGAISTRVWAIKCAAGES